MDKPKGRITLAGAGPGDPELLTVKARKRLQLADVVLHDSLISPEILALVPEKARKVPVGKRYGDGQDQTERQENINRLMVRYAREGLDCVRLKAGDPFVFGRGVEEVRAMLENDIDVEVIPGISAGIAAANIFHIPITERNTTNSVLFCTGHTASYSLEQFDAVITFLKQGTPLVLYMGLKNLGTIVRRLLANGLSPDLPVCAASRVSMSGQRLIRGTLGTICGLMQTRTPTLPVVFLIGEHTVSIDENR